VTATNGRLKSAEIKAAASGRWVEILTAIGIPAESLSGQHCPCPRCGGKDRFRLLDREAGAVLCGQCFSKRNGDGLAAVQWFVGCDFKTALRTVASHLGIEARNGHTNGEANDVDIIGAIAQIKKCPRESLIAYGAVPILSESISIPAFGPDGEQCSSFRIWLNGDEKQKKGKFAAKTKAGLFFPVIDGKPRLPQPGETWHEVEGPKDATALHGLGLLACGLNTSHLAAKFCRLFHDVDVVLIPDRDKAGEDGAAKTARALRGHARSVKIAVLPAEFQQDNGADVRDILSKKGGRDLLLSAISDAQPASNQTDEISNYERFQEEDENGNTKSVTAPIPMGDIIATINARMGNWPRRIDRMLFIDDPQHGLDYFERRTTASLFGWLRRHNTVRWMKGGDYVSEAQLFAEIERTAQRYEGIELLPHEPPIANFYYRGEAPKPGDGLHLGKLIARFRPETTIDRDLIQAAFMTVAWGGLRGSRPAFVVTSDDGRGVGKSKIPEAIGYLYGGSITASMEDDINELKTRMLTPSARTNRVVILDNVKTLRMSWAELEAMITSPTISGYQNYVGEGQRPNLLTWFITLNGVSMATDMSQRSIIIKVTRGKNDGPWWEETLEFIDQHRQQLIGDIIGALRETPSKLAEFSRWATWEKDVLCRLPEPGDAQRLILERQGEADCEMDEAEIIEEHFAEQLEKFGYDSATAQVRIPVAIAARWFGWAVGEPTKTATVTRKLKQMADEGHLKRIKPEAGRSHGRCFIWTGPKADVFGNRIANDLPEQIAHAMAGQDGGR
jgi:phage/plasmid primase-like uncharacterized protein